MSVSDVGIVPPAILRRGRRLPSPRGVRQRRWQHVWYSWIISNVIVGGWPGGVTDRTRFATSLPYSILHTRSPRLPRTATNAAARFTRCRAAPRHLFIHVCVFTFNIPWRLMPSRPPRTARAERFSACQRCRRAAPVTCMGSVIWIFAFGSWSSPGSAWRFTHTWRLPPPYPNTDLLQGTHTPHVHTHKANHYCEHLLHTYLRQTISCVYTTHTTHTHTHPTPSATHIYTVCLCLSVATPRTAVCFIVTFTRYTPRLPPATLVSALPHYTAVLHAHFAYHPARGSARRSTTVVHTHVPVYCCRSRGSTCFIPGIRYRTLPARASHYCCLLRFATHYHAHHTRFAATATFRLALHHAHAASRFCHACAYLLPRPTGSLLPTFCTALHTKARGGGTCSISSLSLCCGLRHLPTPFFG